MLEIGFIWIKFCFISFCDGDAVAIAIAIAFGLFASIEFDCCQSRAAYASLVSKIQILC